MRSAGERERGRRWIVFIFFERKHEKQKEERENTHQKNSPSLSAQGGAESTFLAPN
jgi:hypothetical protein